MKLVYALAVIAVVFSIRSVSAAQFVQQGDAQFLGSLYSASADGNTLLVGGSQSGTSATVYAKIGGAWSAGVALSVGGAGNTSAIALSADGNTAIIGGFVPVSDSGPGAIDAGGTDTASPPTGNGNGGAWVFVRSGGAWTLQAPLICTGALGDGDQGSSVALSADGNTAFVGAPGDNSNQGAVWIFPRAGGIWGQGTKLAPVPGSGRFGSSLAVSADGNTAVISFPQNIGGAWAFARVSGAWTKQGELIGTGEITSAWPSYLQGTSVALSADGNTALSSSTADNNDTGATWVFTRSGGTWTQQAKLVGTGSVSQTKQGSALSLSADGNTALIGGPSDNVTTGAAWVFKRSAGTWAQEGAKLVATGGVGQGSAAMLSPDGTTALIGSAIQGALWTFVESNLGAPIVISPPTLPHAMVGAAYNQVISASGGTGTLTLSTGNLPVPLTFDPTTGLLSGTLKAAGTFNLTFTATDSMGFANANSYSLTIDKGIAAVSLDHLAWAYDGEPKFATAITNPPNLTLAFTYNGSSGLPINVGTYTVIATVNDANYQGSATGTLNIAQSLGITTIVTGPSATPNPATVLQSVAFSASATNSNGDLLTYTWAFGDGAQGSGASVSHSYASPGAYTATVTVTVATGAAPVSSSVQVTVNKANATITLGNLTQVYDGTKKSATATTIPGDLAVNFTYDGSITAPTNAGSYAVVATINDANYQGSATETLNIAKGTASVTLNNLTQVYDGSPKAVTATTNPGSLAVTVTYGGSLSPPSSVGSYNVVGTIVDANYQGSAAGTLNIVNANSVTTIVGTPSAAPNPATVLQPVAFSAAATNSNGDPLTYVWTFGDNVQAVGAAVSHTYGAPGTYTATLTVSGGAAPVSASVDVTVVKAQANVMLENLSQVFDGSPKVVSAVTNPANLIVVFTYDGSSTPPTSAGTYTVVGTVFDAAFQGSATGVLSIANPSGSVTTISSGPTAAPNPAAVAQTVLFFVIATNSKNDALAYTWDFGDGAGGVGASVSHAYTSAGTYSAVVTVTSTGTPVSASVQVIVAASAAVIGSGPDSDGDGFSDSFELAVGTNPNDATSTPTGGAITVASVQQLTVTKASLKLNFARKNSDSISFSGVVPFPAGFKPAGAKVYLDAGGVIKTIVLSANGGGAANTDSVKIGLKSHKGAVPAQVAKYSVTLKSGSFAATLAGAGLANADTHSAPVAVPFALIVNDLALQTTRTMSYTAKQGKSGAAK